VKLRWSCDEIYQTLLNAPWQNECQWGSYLAVVC